MAITIVGATVALAIGLYALAVYPLTVRIAAAREREAEAAQSLATARESYQAARTTMEEKSVATEQIDRFYREVLPQDLAGARGITYARLAALARDHDLVMERRSSVADQIDGSDLSRLRTTMLLAGEWADIRLFIAAVEDAREFIVIEDIALSQSEEVGASLVLALGLSTFYRVEAGA